MTPANASRLVLAFARALFVNGQATDETLGAGERLARALGLNATILPRWGELELQMEDLDPPLPARVVAADPAGVNMTRVVGAMRAFEDVDPGTLPASSAADAVSAIAHLPPAPTWLFALAAGAGAVALAVLFGIEHLPSALLIFASAAAGALLRRGLALISDNLFLQPFAAALLAGLVGALAVRLELSSSLRLV